MEFVEDSSPTTISIHLKSLLKNVDRQSVFVLEELEYLMDLILLNQARTPHSSVLHTQSKLAALNHPRANPGFALQFCTRTK
jgi:hypothetical protein